MSLAFQKKKVCRRAIFSAIFTDDWKLLRKIISQNERISRQIMGENKNLIIELARRRPKTDVMEYCLSSDVCTMRLFSEVVFQYVINKPLKPVRQCFLLQSVIRLSRPQELLLERVDLQPDVTFIHFRQFCLPLKMDIDLRMFICCLLLACGCAKPRKLTVSEDYPNDCLLYLILERYRHSVPSLQSLCRCCIRSNIASLDSSEMEKLPLPNSMLVYVNTITINPL